MNILILTTHLNPGGLSRYVLNLSSALKKRGHKVWVACSGGEWVKRLEAEGVGYKQIFIKTKSICSIKILFSFLALSKFIRREKINLVQANTRVTQFLSFLIHKSFNIPYVGGFHGFYRSSRERKCLKFSGIRSIAVSKAVRKHLIDDLAISKDKIRVVYNGIDNKEFLTKEAERSDWGFKDEDYLIGILGRISEEKGHFLAIGAIAKLCSKYKNIYFLVSGKGKMEEKLRGYIEEKGIKERVKFINCSPNKFLDIIDLLLMPSKKEGFGYSIIEAFTKEVPVIGYNTGGVAEIIKNKENGFLFYRYDVSSLAEAIEEVISNTDLNKRIVQQAKEDVLYFSASRMAEDTEKVYREIC